MMFFVSHGVVTAREGKQRSNFVCFCVSEIRKLYEAQSMSPLLLVCPLALRSHTGLCLLCTALVVNRPALSPDPSHMIKQSWPEVVNREVPTMKSDTLQLQPSLNKATLF